MTTEQIISAVQQVVALCEEAKKTRPERPA